MKSVITGFILVSFILFQGCSSNRLTTLEDNEHCPTVVEGYYSSPRIWKSMFPAVLLKDGNLKLGSEIKRDTSGIMFVAKATRIFQSTDTLFIPFSDIQTLIDSTRICTYGEIPKNYSNDGLQLNVFLSCSEDSTYQPIYFDLDPNEDFAYCIRPGDYSINKIQFMQKGNVDESLELPDLKFHADSGKTNYLGDLNLITSTNEPKNCIIIPYKNIHNAGESAAIGFMFGLIGTAVHEALKSKNDDADGYYLINITDDPHFRFISAQSPVRNILGNGAFQQHHVLSR